MAKFGWVRTMIDVAPAVESVVAKKYEQYVQIKPLSSVNTPSRDLNITLAY